jgi:type IV pilus assembly protein PilC
MPRYQYIATDEAGRTHREQLEASSAADAAQQLEARGLHVVSVSLATEPASPSSPADVPFPLNSKEFDTVSGQIVDLTRAKLPLASGLSVLADELPNKRLRRALRGMASRLEKGMDIEQVLLAYDAPPELRAVFVAGRTSGNISDVLAQYITHRRSRANRRLLMTIALGYPVTLLATAAAIVLFMLVYLVPNFRKIILDFGAEAPLSTRFLFGISDIVTRFAPFVIGVLAVIAVTTYVAYRLFQGRGLANSIARRIPWFGSLWHWTAMAQFCHLLAIMLENRVPLPKALLLAGDGTEDDGVRAGSRQMAAAVAAGEPLVATGRVMRGFPAAFIQVVTEHKQTDALPGALHAIADFFEGRSRLQGNFLAAVCGPIVILVVGIVIGMMVIGMFTPLVKLLNELS